MTELQRAIKELEDQIKRWKNWKNRPGTKIHYAELRLAKLKKMDHLETKVKPPSAKRPRRPVVQRRPAVSPSSLQNSAYVLHLEIHDLTQAIVALERMRQIG